MGSRAGTAIGRRSRRCPGLRGRSWWRSHPATGPGTGRERPARCWRTASTTWPTGCGGRLGRDGESFEPLLVVDKDEFGAESLERPALAIAPDGGWRLYMSCATPGTLHWRVDVLEAANPAGFDPARRRTVLPGNEATAVKDPVI